MLNEKKKLIYKCLTSIFYILMIIFIIDYLKEIDFDLILGAGICWKVVAVSFVIRMIGLLISPFSWELLLKRYHGKMMNQIQIYKIYAESWMGRYIPGKVGWIGGKILFATNEGVRIDTAMITSFLDSILQVFSSMLVAIVAFIGSRNLLEVDGQNIVFIYIITIIMIICLIPGVFNRLISLVYKMLKHKNYSPEYWMDGKTIISSTLIVSIAKLFSSVAVAILAVSVLGKLSFYNFIYIMAVNLTATAIGMAALFAPAGLGVKESIQIVLLSAIMNKEMALIIVTLASLQSILGDVTFFLATRMLKNDRREHSYGKKC